MADGILARPPAPADTADGPAPRSGLAAFADRLVALARPDPDDTRDAPARGDVPGELPSVPGYEILRVLGRGGMGVVYEGRQLGLNRPVALKMVLAGGHASPRDLVRFLAEAEAVAAVRHPHVVEVYEFGDRSGRPYLAMEFCPGGSLAERLAGGKRLPPAEAAALVGKVASGVQAAHALGIVHRDLKPGNVLFDAKGDPKVTDFGLAKRGTGSDLTATQAVMGTPWYMAPEQAAGLAKFVGPPADVWALGVVLYECLTGKKPFDGDDLRAILDRVMNADPERPRTLDLTIPRDLELVCLKCLSKEPHERYPSAAGLADELARFARGEPVSVRAPGLLERGYKWARRKPTTAGLYAAAVVAALFIAVSGGFAWLWRDARDARDAAETARGDAERARHDTEWAKQQVETLNGQLDVRNRELTRSEEKLAVFEYGRTMQVAHQEWRENNVPATLALLEGTRKDLRGWEHNYVHRLCHSEVLTLKGHTSIVFSASFSPDGLRVVTGSYDGTARVWDARSGAELLTLKGHTGIVWSASFSPAGSRIVAASADTARVWDSRPFRDTRPSDPELAPPPREKR